MTCIIGFIDKINNVTYIGADSCGSTSYSKRSRKDKKVFKLIDNKETLIGFTSSYRMGQLLMYAKDLLSYTDIVKSENEEEDTELKCYIEDINHENMVTTVVENIANVLLDGGFAKDSPNGLEGGVMLFANKDKLYRIDIDFQVEETEEDYNACGSGEAYALGSLMTTESMDLTSIEKIHLALQVAARFAAGVEGPFYIMNTLNDEVIKFDN